MRTLHQEIQLRFHYPVHFTTGLFDRQNPLLEQVAAAEGVHGSADPPTAWVPAVGVGSPRSADNRKSGDADRKVGATARRGPESVAAAEGGQRKLLFVVD